MLVYTITVVYGLLDFFTIALLFHETGYASLTQNATMFQHNTIIKHQ